MKHAKRSKFEKFLIRNKAVLLVATFVIFTTSILNVSYAYFKDEDKVVNLIKTGKIETEIKEDFDPSIGKKNVWIVNPSTSDALMRVSISGRWVDPADESKILPDGNELVKLNFAEGYEANWYYCEEDGYYYYKKILQGKTETDESISEMLLEGVTFKDEEIAKDPIYIGKEYRIEIKSEAVQATRYKDYDNLSEEDYIYPFTKVWSNLTEEVTNMLKGLIDNIQSNM